MTTLQADAPKEKKALWSDTHLVRECLKGSDEAWSRLIEKYQNLIFSIPIKYGFSTDEAAEIFQGVCLELLSELPALREPRALPKWLIQITAHRCFHFRRQEQRYVSGEQAETKLASLMDPSENTEAPLHEAEQEQFLREAVIALPPRCRRLIEMLFFESPARPYQEIAKSLSIAAGSVGFIRGRCLQRLRDQLEKLGFR
jgi:RNA polymerase sigma factor (sigma-70 family)